MACAITTGRSEPCKDAIGGIKAFYTIEWLEDSFTVSGGEATALNGSVTAAFEWDLLSDNNNFEESGVGDTNNGTFVVTQTLNASLKKQDKDTAAELALVLKNRPVIVVKFRDGSYKVMGRSDGTRAEAVAVSGGAKADFNGYNLTITAEETDFAPTLDSSTVTAFEAVISGTKITP